MTQIQKVSATHEQIMNWLVLNPEKSMRECADAFGYTQAWLSTLVHSDAFQAKLAEKQQLVQARVCASIPEKLNRVTDVALDKLATMVEASEDPEFILNVADKALHKLGFGPATARNPQGGTITQQNNVYMVSAEELMNARQLMGQQHALAAPPQARPAGVPSGKGLPKADFIEVDVIDISARPSAVPSRTPEGSTE
jgi:hypothetical protein